MSAPAPLRILVFAKAPVAGRVKTRLAGLLGEPGAALLYARLVAHAVEVAAQAALRIGAEVEMWCDPSTDHPTLREIAARHGASLHAQSGGDLGERMLGAATDALTRGTRYLLTGTDIPAMDADCLERAAASLDHAEVVLVPSADGGYVLIGGRIAPRECFTAIAWSTHTVLASTRTALTRAGVRWAELPALWDLDEPSDLRRLAALPQGAALLAGMPRAGEVFASCVPATPSP